MAVDLSQFSPDLQEAYRRLLEIYGGTLPAIKSGYRDPATNKSVGGAKGSQHLHGNAIDWATSGMSQEERLNFLNAARQAGFQGFGGYSSGNVHTDVGQARYWGDDYSGKSAPDWLKSWYSGAQPESVTRKTDMSMNPNAPQRTGLLGFMDLMREPDPSTGMTAMERFGAALDPLLAPEQRMGETFAASGAQRLQTQSRNRTIETLKQRAAAGDLIARDVLSGLESGAYDAKTAMSLYLGKRFETPTQTETFTNMTGKQLNEKFGTELDPTKMYNVSSSGKITQVGGGDTIIGGSEKAWEKGIGELGVKTLEKIQNDAASAVDMLGQTQILTSLMNDPAFQSGALQEPKMAYQKIVEALGGDPANVGTQEAFQAVTAQLILDKMGGSLGAGFSEGDRKFVERMAPSLSTSRTGNQLIIKMNNAIANRKIQINEFANQYIAENGMLDQNFNAALSKWAKENPIFVDINPTDYFN